MRDIDTIREALTVRPHSHTQPWNEAISALARIESVLDVERLLGWGYATQGREDWTDEDEKLLLGLALMSDPDSEWHEYNDDSALTL